MAKYLKVEETTGLIKEQAPITVSTGAPDASSIAQTGSDGRFDVSLMPVGIAPEVTIAPASENLDAGNYINLWNDSGTLKARKADNSNGREAHGYILVSVTSGQDAYVYHEAANTSVSGKTLGARQFLGTGGATTETVPTGNVLLQVLGFAVTATEIETNIHPPIQRIA